MQERCPRVCLYLRAIQTEEGVLQVRAQNPNQHHRLPLKTRSTQYVGAWTQRAIPSLQRPPRRQSGKGPAKPRKGQGNAATPLERKALLKGAPEGTCQKRWCFIVEPVSFIRSRQALQGIALSCDRDIVYTVALEDCQGEKKRGSAINRSLSFRMASAALLLDKVSRFKSRQANISTAEGLG